MFEAKPREQTMLRRRALMTMALAQAGTQAVAAPPPLTLVPGTLKIGTYFVNPPFEFIQDGSRVGFEIDLMNDVARRLRLRPLYINTQWETILQEMSEHRYDCIIGGITITPGRERTLRWSSPYLTTTLSLIVNAARTPGIRQLADLRTASVGVQAVTTDYDIAVKMQRDGEFGKIVVYPFDKISDAILDLEAGRITAVMKVAPVADYLVRQTPDLKIIAQVPNDPQPLGIGFAKNGGALQSALNAALASMKSDGTIARLMQQWGITG
jgi:ABC-type amino acid transport substrate-binding protein